MATNMNQYLLILRADPAVFRQMSPQQMQETFNKYHGWRVRLTEAGRVTGGHKLEDTARVLRAGGQSNEMRITDGPFAESKEVIGGFFLVNADSYEDAAALCQDCPHLEFGAIEVRRIEF
jgi:hypothetical protein